LAKFWAKKNEKKVLLKFHFGQKKSQNFFSENSFEQKEEKSILKI